MVVTPSEIEDRLRSSFNPTILTVTDDSDGCGAKFTVIVVSASFDGVPLLERHRLVHASIGESLLPRIHALTIKAWTPEQSKQKGLTGSA